VGEVRNKLHCKLTLYGEYFEGSIDTQFLAEIEQVADDVERKMNAVEMALDRYAC
jgi:hypothetical protein